MLATVLSSALQGIDATLVEVEVDLRRGLPQLSIVGLPEAAVRESRERVRSAIRNSGYEFPAERITINLAPADLRKEGSAYDLPIALGLLAAAGTLPRDRRRAASISPRSAASSTPSARSRSPPRAGTTCCWSVRPGRERPCWRYASPRFCPRRRWPKRSRSPRSTASRGCSTASRCSAR